MRYPCLANPNCLKTFDNGHALRAHVAGCEKAQEKLKAKADTEKLEHDIALSYSGIYGLHRNTYYPTAHHLDNTQKFQFKDRNNFIYSFDSSANPVKSVDPSLIRSTRKPVPSNLMNSTQIKQVLSYQQ